MLPTTSSSYSRLIYGDCMLVGVLGSGGGGQNILWPPNFFIGGPPFSLRHWYSSPRPPPPPRSLPLKLLASVLATTTPPSSEHCTQGQYSAHVSHDGVASAGSDHRNPTITSDCVGLCMSAESKHVVPATSLRITSGPQLDKK